MASTKKSAKKAAKKSAAKPNAGNAKGSKPETKKKLLPDILVKRDKSNFVTICFIGDLSVRVDPGVTRITDQEVLECIANPKLNRNWLGFISQGVHKLVEGREQSGTNKTTVFTAMTNDDSIALVKDSYSVPALERMHADENSKRARKSVLNAIMDQIAEIKAPPPVKKETENA